MPGEFWDNEYYGDPSLPLAPSDSFSYERTLAAALREMAPLTSGQSVVEIGCAPARWLVWYGRTFSAHVSGLEYSAKGAGLSRANLAAAGMTPAIVEADFFDPGLDMDPTDLVLSLGFIEHFDDLERAFRRHLDFCVPGGRVAIGVPNFRGFTGLMQRWASPGFLAAHNTAAMDPALFGRFAANAGWTLEAHRYLDSFEPRIIHVERRGPAAVLLPLMPLRRMRWTDKINHPRLSSYLLMTFRRQQRTAAA
jgi:SAM-dependent methyltransferase